MCAKKILHTHPPCFIATLDRYALPRPAPLTPPLPREPESRIRRRRQPCRWRRALSHRRWRCRRQLVAWGSILRSNAQAPRRRRRSSDGVEAAVDAGTRGWPSHRRGKWDESRTPDRERVAHSRREARRCAFNEKFLIECANKSWSHCEQIFVKSERIRRCVHASCVIVEPKAGDDVHRQLAKRPLELDAAN